MVNIPMKIMRGVTDMTNNSQNDCHNHDSSAWKCVVCNAVNDGNFCIVCGAPKPNGEMKKKCPGCGFQNNANARFCSNCARKLDRTWLDAFKEFLKNNWKLLMIGAVLVVILAGFLFKPHEHTWEEATCTNPKTCTSCGETSGTTAAHQWKAATCADPKTCKKN